MAKPRKGKPPIVARCLDCGEGFSSRYACKTHACKGESGK